VHHIEPWRSFGQGAAAKRRANALDNLITLCKACHAKAERALGLHGALTGVGFALSQIAPLFLMCDPGDLGVSAVAQAPWTQRPTIVLYERAAAGVGFGEALFGRHEALVTAARALIADCPCRLGCPSCVGPADAASDEAKAHALAVLDVLGSRSHAS
jgi:DEAD/DEAH box helicase domain-containing protein